MTNSTALPAGFEVESVGKPLEASALPEGFEIESVPEEESLLRKTGRAVKGVLDIPENVTKNVLLPFSENIATQAVGGAGGMIGPAVATRNYLTTLAGTGSPEKAYESASRGARETGEFFGSIAEKIPTTELGKKSSEYVAKGFEKVLGATGGIAREAVRVPLQPLRAMRLPEYIAKPIEDTAQFIGEVGPFGAFLKGGGKVKSLVRDIYNERKGMPPKVPTVEQFKEADVSPVETAEKEFKKPEVRKEYETFLDEVEGKRLEEERAWEGYERYPELPEGFEVESLPDISVEKSSYAPSRDARSVTGDVSKIDTQGGERVDAGATKSFRDYAKERGFEFKDLEKDKDTLFNLRAAYAKEVIGIDTEARAKAALDASAPKQVIEQKQGVFGKLGDKLKSEAGSVITAQKKPFYSKLEEFVNKDMKLSLPIDSARKMAYNKGVTVDEWNDTFGHLRGKVTKEQLLDELAVHGRKFEDVVLGGEGWNENQSAKFTKLVKDNDNFGYDSVGGAKRDLITGALSVDSVEWRNAADKAKAKELLNLIPTPVQFEQYSEPGFIPGSSRELFVTASTKLDKTKSPKRGEPDFDEALDALDKYPSSRADWRDGHGAYNNITNPITRIRFNEREVNGKKVLFVEEVQGPNPENQTKMPESIRSRIYDIGVKRVVSYAKENGFDEIAWANGKMQADRYSLEKHLDSVKVDAFTEGAYGVRGYKDGMKVISKVAHTKAELVELVGKDLAEKATQNFKAFNETEAAILREKLTADLQAVRNSAEDIVSSFEKQAREALDEALRTGQISDGEYYTRYANSNYLPGSELTPAAKNRLSELKKVEKALLKTLDNISYPRVEFEGLDLKVGGEGLKRLYDEVIPGLMEKYGGGKVKDSNLLGDESSLASYTEDSLLKSQRVKTLPLTEKSPSSFTMYSDPFGFQASAKALGKMVEEARDGWEQVLEKNPTIAKLDEKARTRIEEIYRGIKEGTLDPERIMREDPYAHEIIKNLFNAEESKNAFMQKVMPAFLEATKGIKKGSDSSARIGKVLDGQESVDILTAKERKAFDFFKENYDWMIHEYARNAAGSEANYRKILALVNNKQEKRSRVKDLNPEDRAEYDRLRQIATEIKGEKKINELDQNTRDAYERAAQQARDFLHNDFKKNMSEGERAAYDILSRKLTDYLPHLFDKKELKEMFESDLTRIRKKLEGTTKKELITKYKNQIAEVERALANLEGGKWVNFRDLPKDVFFRFFTERKGAKGYSLDAVKAFESYVYGIARKIYDEPALRKSYELYEKVGPELKPYTKELVNHYMGYEPKSYFNNFARFVTTYEWIRTLGLNPRSALVNLTQRLNTAVWVGEKYAIQAQKMMFLDKAKADALFDRSGVAREIPQVLMEGPVAPSLQGLRSVTGVLFDMVEKGNRQHAFLSGYLKAKAKGISEDLAIKEGIKIVHKTQFRYGKLGMAKWSRGPGGRIALQFLSYPLKQAQFLYDLYKKDKLAFMRFAAYTIGGNLTLQELLDTDMSNAVGFGITFGEMLKAVQSASEGDARGAGRHFMQAFSPGGGLLPAGLGPAASAVVKTGYASATEGKGTEQLIKEITPIMWTRLKQAYKGFKEGSGSEYPIFDEKGRKAYNLNARQLVQRTLGPRTDKERREGLVSREERNLEQERREVMVEVAKRFADGILDGDETAIDDAADLMVKYGIDIDSQQLKNEIEARLLTREERKIPGKKEFYQLQREGETVRDKYSEEED